MKVGIVIPAWNEELRIGRVIENIHKVSKDYMIIVSDDGSTDRTKDIALEHKANVVSNEHVGKGHTARKGCDYAYHNGCTHIVLIDGDGQHQAKDIPRFLDALEGKDVVFSHRIGEDQPLKFRVGNWGLNLISYILHGIHIKDTQSGFRAFTRKAYRKLRWRANKYDMESEMIARARGMKYTEIPIKLIYHERNKGTGIRDGLRIGLKLFQWRFS